MQLGKLLTGSLPENGAEGQPQLLRAELSSKIR